MNYKQLTQEQRYHIYGLLKGKMSQKDITNELGVHKSTISRELSRNAGKRGYRSKQAQEFCDIRHRSKPKFIRFTEAIKLFVTEKIKEDWSPEQISGYLKVNERPFVSHETIYQFLLRDKNDGGILYQHLRHSNRKRKKRYGSKDTRGQIKNRVSIEERPKIVNQKSRIGDWEGDTIIGQNNKQAVISMVERKSKFTLLKKSYTKFAEEVEKLIISMFKCYSSNVLLTLTLDNGKEFSFHEKISKALEMAIYFAHPYSSWERGLNENTNGLVRQYIPKGSNFSDITDRNLQMIMDKLNHRPRKALGYKTPWEVFYEDAKASGF